MNDWNEDALSLGRPNCMDTPTLLEWIQRQLETPEETAARLDALREEHEEWHRNTPGIYSCCIRTGPSLILTVNERRLQAGDEQYRRIIDTWKKASETGQTMVLGEGMTVTPYKEIMDMRKPGEAFCSDCPDHEGCMQGVPCSLAKRVNKKDPDPKPEETFFTRRPDGR